VHRPEHPVELAGSENLRDLVAVPVRLAELKTGEDSQLREALAALIYGGQVADGVEGRRGEHSLVVAETLEQVVGFEIVEGHSPDRVVEMLGEGDGRQAEFDRAGARRHHVTVGRVPRPLAVHVAVSRQDHAASLRPETVGGPPLSSVHLAGLGCPRRPARHWGPHRTQPGRGQSSRATPLYFTVFAG